MATKTLAPEFWTTRLVREPGPPEVAARRLRGPDDAAEVATILTRDEPCEVMVAFALNARHRIVGAWVVSRGIVDATLIHPREVFRPAIISNACAVIVAHNHPTGDTSPSPEDNRCARQLADAGEKVGIRLLDFLVVNSDGDYESVDLSDV